MFTQDELNSLNLKPPTITLTNAMLEAYKRLPQIDTQDPLKKPLNPTTNIPQIINGLKAKGVTHANEDAFTQHLFNILDDAYLAISMSRSGVEFNTPTLAQQKIDAKAEADRIEAERLQKIEDDRLEALRIEAEPLQKLKMIG